MSKTKKNILRGIFLFVLICFFFPFVTVSCQNKEIETLNGINMVTGKKIDTGYGTEKIKPQKFAILALIVAVAGLAITFVKFNKSSLVFAASGLLGFMLILLQRHDISGQIEENEYVTVDYKIGFYLLLLSFLAAAIYSAYLFILESTSVPDTTSNTINASGAKKKFCTKCGAENSGGNAFCIKCGEKMEI